MRSFGTNTLSNIRMASPSSNRLLSGRSNAAWPWWKLSRASVVRPGAFIGTTKASGVFVLARLARIVGADVALVRHRRERRQHAAAADHDAVARALDDVHGLGRRIEGRAVGLRVDQRVGDLHVVLAAMLDDRLGARRRLGAAHHPERHHVVDQEARHEVGQPAHQAEGPERPEMEAAGELVELRRACAPPCRSG